MGLLNPVWRQEKTLGQSSRTSERRVEERCLNTRYHLANTDDSYRVRLEQQLNQIIDLRTDDLGTVSSKIISAYFKNNNVRF